MTAQLKLLPYPWGPDVHPSHLLLPPFTPEQLAAFEGRTVKARKQARGAAPSTPEGKAGSPKAAPARAGGRRA